MYEYFLRAAGLVIGAIIGAIITTLMWQDEKRRLVLERDAAQGREELAAKRVVELLTTLSEKDGATHPDDFEKLVT